MHCSFNMIGDRVNSRAPPGNGVDGLKFGTLAWTRRRFQAAPHTRSDDQRRRNPSVANHMQELGKPIFQRRRPIGHCLGHGPVARS